MNAAKKKAPTIAVPQSDAAADALLKEYGDEFNLLVAHEAVMNAQLADAKASFERVAQPHQERLKTIFEQLQAWGAAHRDRLTDDGKSKTVLLPAGSIGWRNRPPSVRWKKGFKAEDIVEAIKKYGLRRHRLGRRGILHRALRRRAGGAEDMKTCPNCGHQIPEMKLGLTSRQRDLLDAIRKFEAVGQTRLTPR